MSIQLLFTSTDDEHLPVVTLDSASTISSWLVEHYFLKIYSNQLKANSKSTAPKNIIGFHDMFIVYQIIQSSSTLIDFVQFCQKKLEKSSEHLLLDQYNQYLKRCGLTDLIDLWEECQLRSTMKMLVVTSDHVKTELDRLFLENLLDSASTGGQSVKKLLQQERKPLEQTISKNYIKHTLYTYLSLLLDTRNEHALVHCLLTPARGGIERRTIVELRRLSRLPKNESLTIYQILLTFVRRKELILSRLSSSQPDSTSNDDESFVILEKYYSGIKEFFDFLEQLQMKIEEDEHLKIESSVTFRQLLGSIVKQLRKDVSFHRCESLIKEVIEEFCSSFQTTLSLIDCSTPIRSASSGGTLAGRRFLRSVSYLCAKQTIDLPVLATNNEHYDSPSTGLRKATASRLLRSPLTPILIVAEPVPEKPVEEKPAEIPAESVFIWQKKSQEDSTGSKRYRRRKSHRCLDLSTIPESSSELNSIGQSSTDSESIGSQRQPLADININSLNSETRQGDGMKESSQHSISFSLVSESDQENVASQTTKKRSIAATNIDQPRKKQKKANVKPLIVGQKSIMSFFQSKS